MDDVLEVWDLRKLQRTKVIDWDGTGQTLFNVDEEEGDTSDEPKEIPEGEEGEEEKKEGEEADKENERPEMP